MKEYDGLLKPIKPTKPTSTFIEPNPVLIREDSNSDNNGLVIVLSVVIVILLTIILNTKFPGRDFRKPVVYNVEKVVTKVVVKEKEPLMNLSNNEKAALFLVIPGSIMGYFLITGIGAGARAGKQKYDKFGRKYI